MILDDRHVSLGNKSTTLPPQAIHGVGIGIDVCLEGGNAADQVPSVAVAAASRSQCQSGSIGIRLAAG